MYMPTISPKLKSSHVKTFRPPPRSWRQDRSRNTSEHKSANGNAAWDLFTDSSELPRLPYTIPQPAPRGPIGILNANWRVISAPTTWPSQWILQRKKGCARAKNDGWIGNAYCITRDALLRTIRERCGKAHPEAIAILKALPASIPSTKKGIGR